MFLAYKSGRRINMGAIIDGFQNLMAIKEFEIFFKLVLIVFLAGLVGYERESWKKPAGFRTYVLVGISAVLVMICGELLYKDLGADPTRIPAIIIWYRIFRSRNNFKRWI